MSLKLFLANVFDIEVSQDFTSQFVSNNNLNIDVILNHPLLIVNYLYYKIWHYCYKTYPTKKDFNSFTKEFKISIFSAEPVNGQLIEKIVNHFFPLRLGFIKYIDVKALCEHVEKELIPKWSDKNVIQSFLIDKWNYHFGKNNDHGKVENESNIFMKFVTMYKEYQTNSNSKIVIENPHLNIVDNSLNENISFDEFDNAYMTCFEKYQFILYSDINVFIRCVDSACIILDKDINEDVNIIKEIVSLYDKQFNKLPILICLNTSRDPKSATIHDAFHTFYVDKTHLYMFPRIFKACLLVSNTKFPIYPSLCKQSQQSLYYILTNETSIVKNKDIEEITDTYNRILIPQLSFFKKYNTNADRRKKLYLAPRFYDDMQQNPDSFVHRCFIVDSKTYDQYRSQIDSFCARFDLACSLPRDKNFKGDFYLNMNDAIDCDVLEYSINGVISILKTRYEMIHPLINGMYVKTIDEALSSMLHLYESPHVVKQFKINSKSLKTCYNAEYFKIVWKDHLNHECPVNCNPSQKNNKNNVLLLHNFIFGYFDSHLEKIVGIKTSRESPYQVILLDNRENAMSVISTLFTLCNLKSEYWGCKIYTSKKSIDFYQKYLGHVCEIFHLEDLDIPVRFHIDTYNTILKNTSFWKQESMSSTEKCLIIQDDGFLIREGVEDFIKYDYVGAPWADVPDNNYLKNNVNPEMVGNGGLSLRTKSKMIEVAEKYPNEKNILFYKNILFIPEDVFFCKCLSKDATVTLPSKEEAVKFASEEMCCMDSLGCHKIWVYHDANVIASFFEKAI
jgi:hypothetical protein